MTVTSIPASVWVMVCPSSAGVNPIDIWVRAPSAMSWRTSPPSWVSEMRADDEAAVFPGLGDDADHVACSEKRYTPVSRGTRAPD